MARVAGFNPYTLAWNMEDNPVRMVVTGEIEGFNISFNFYDSDFNSYNEDGELNGLSMYEVGVIQVLTSELLRHGVLPVRRGSSQEQQRLLQVLLLRSGNALSMGLLLFTLLSLVKACSVTGGLKLRRGSSPGLREGGNCQRASTILLSSPRV